MALTAFRKKSVNCSGSKKKNNIFITKGKTNCKSFDAKRNRQFNVKIISMYYTQEAIE